MLQSNGIDVNLIAAFIVTSERRFDVIVDMDSLHVILDHEFLRKALAALVAVLKIVKKAKKRVSGVGGNRTRDLEDLLSRFLKN